MIRVFFIFGTHSCFRSLSWPSHDGYTAIHGENPGGLFLFRSPTTTDEKLSPVKLYGRNPATNALARQLSALFPHMPTKKIKDNDIVT